MINKIMQMIKNGKVIMALLALLFVVPAVTPLLAAEKFPQPRGAVNDFANLIDPASEEKMEALAREVLQKTGTAIVVVTVPTIGEGEETSMYVNKLYQAWGIGKKGEDKGVLIFLTVKERKIRIETGYGVEGILPDGLVGEIRDKYFKPQLQAGNYGQAFYDTMYVLSSYIAKDANVELSGSPAPLRPKARTEPKGINISSLIILLILAFFFFGTKTGRSVLPWLLLLLMSGGGRGGGYSGGFGGGFGGFGGGGSGGGGAGGDY